MGHGHCKEKGGPHLLHADWPGLPASLSALVISFQACRPGTLQTHARNPGSCLLSFSCNDSQKLSNKKGKKRTFCSLGKDFTFSWNSST